MSYGINVKHNTTGSRVEVGCNHQRGLLYVVPAQASWVCTPELIHAHALAGLLSDLCALKDPAVQGAMQKWGIYYRDRPLTEINST